MVKSNFHCLSKQHYKYAVQFISKYRCKTEILKGPAKWSVTVSAELRFMTSYLES